MSDAALARRREGRAPCAREVLPRAVGVVGRGRTETAGHERGPRRTRPAGIEVLPRAAVAERFGERLECESEPRGVERGQRFVRTGDQPVGRQ
jgi:hypothetical protein